MGNGAAARALTIGSALGTVAVLFADHRQGPAATGANDARARVA